MMLMYLHLGENPWQKRKIESEEKGIGLEVYPIKDSVKIIISNY